MFNIKGFGLKKLPQRKGGDGKGQGHQGQSRMEPRVVLSALHGVAWCEEEVDTAFIRLTAMVRVARSPVLTTIETYHPM